MRTCIICGKKIKFLAGNKIAEKGKGLCFDCGPRWFTQNAEWYFKESNKGEYGIDYASFRPHEMREILNYRQVSLNREQWYKETECPGLSLSWDLEHGWFRPGGGPTKTPFGVIDNSFMLDLFAFEEIDEIRYMCPLTGGLWLAFRSERIPYNPKPVKLYADEIEAQGSLEGLFDKLMRLMPQARLKQVYTRLLIDERA